MISSKSLKEKSIKSNCKDNLPIPKINKSKLNDKKIKFNEKLTDFESGKNMRISSMKCIKIALQENLIDFCYITNMHGFNMLRQHEDFKGDSKWIKLIKKLKVIVWFSAILSGMIFGICLFARVYMRYRITPTITTIETNNYPISNVPFPAVTICNVNSIYGPHTDELTAILLTHNISTEHIQSFYRNLSSLITFNKLSSEFTGTFKILHKLGYSPRDLMRSMIQPCERMLKQCNWLGKSIDCMKIFHLESSESGFCCSFNYKSLRSTLKKRKTATTTKKPGFLATGSRNLNKTVNKNVRVAAAGDQLGLQVAINVETEYYISPRRLFYGAEVIIHDPEDFPQTSLVSAYAQPGTEVSVAITPSIFVTEPDVRDLPVDLRFCIFGDEKQLQITNKYDFQSCVIQCRALKILKICNCLPFFYPKVFTTNSSVPDRECDFEDVDCLNENRHIVSSLAPPSEINSILNVGVDGLHCNCLPSCTEQLYNVETFISQRFKNVNSTCTLRDHQWITYSLVKVYFKDISCIKYRREVFMKWDDLVSSFGGIFGLCLGGSVLSFLEILYFATIRLCEKYLKTKSKMEMVFNENMIQQIKFIYPKKEFKTNNNINVINKSKLKHEYLWDMYKF